MSKVKGKGDLGGILVSMIVDGVGSAQTLDKSGERVLIEGLDISDYVGQKAPVIYEHKAGAKGTAVDVVGRVLFARKIFTVNDCQTERQKMYWDMVRMPMLYVIVRIRDGEGNVGADALAAEIRSAKKHNEPKILGFSVGGHTIERQGNILSSCVGRELTLTYKPANAVCALEEIDPAVVGMTKSEAMILTRGPDLVIEDPELPADLAKTYEAGGYDAAPGSLTQGSALQKEALKGKIEDVTKDEVPLAPPPMPHRASGDGLLSSASPCLERLVTNLRSYLGRLAPGPVPEGQMWPGGPQIRSISLVNGDEPIALGRIMILNGQVHHLEDYLGKMRNLISEGPLDEHRLARLHVLETSPHLHYDLDHEPEIEEEGAEDTESQPADTTSDVLAPEPDATPASESVDQLQAPPSGRGEAYRYQRAGSANDAILEVSGEHAYLNGIPLSPAILDLMLQNVESGAATLVPEGLAKMEDLEKAVKRTKAPPMDPATALEHVRAAVKAGHIHPSVAAGLTHHIYNDQKVGVPMGNPYAYQEFLKHPRPGVHVGLDMNGMKGINDTYGHAAGDKALKGFFGAVRQAVDESVGRKNAKTFRPPSKYDAWRQGGDEGAVFLPSHEHAVKFAHTLNQKLAALPPIGGTHKISASVGIGPTPEHADKAMYHAKANKLTTGGKQKYRAGQIPSFAHSLTPGKEGPIKLHTEAPPVSSPPLAAPTKVKAPKAAKSPKPSKV